MRILDICSGVGGFSLSATWVWGNELDILSFVEIDPFCRKVLKKHWPNVPIIEDLHNVKGRDFQGADIVCGGIPCQPASMAGKRLGSKDDRWLWGEAVRVVQEVKPRWVLFENVLGFLSIERGLAFERVCSQLEKEGYWVESFVLPACAVNAPHRRDRIWIVARNTGSTQPRGLSSIEWEKDSSPWKSDQDAQNTKGERCGSLRDERNRTETHGPIAKRNSAWDEHWYEAALRTCNVRVDDGLSGGLDRVNGVSTKPKDKASAGRIARLKALGNAIVPQVAAEIFRAIKTIDEENRNDEL